jgi:predicted N-acetyltransferase YhbS
MNKIELHTKRLLLRSWREDDAESLFKYASDPKVGPISGWPPHTSVENSRQIIRDVLSADETYAVVLIETGEPVGSVGLMLSQRVHSANIGENEGEIGYWIGFPYWGQGLIPEAVNELMRHGFEDLNLDAIWCGYYDGNEKSKRVQEKCGFEYHHTETDKPCPMLGERRIEHFTSITKQRWKDFYKLTDHSISIRLERPADYEAVERLTFAAFENFEAEGVPKRDIPNEHFLVQLLRNDPDFVPELDFIAERDGEVIGNIMYSKCVVLRSDGTETDALVFGPVSVKPDQQRQGIGTRLIERSLDRARELGYKSVIITGFPDYYHRFGFVSASGFGLTMPDGTSFEAFMALELEEGYLGTDGGKWKCCKAFDICENDEVAFKEYHSKFSARRTL